MWQALVIAIGILTLWYWSARWARNSRVHRAWLRSIGDALFLPVCFAGSFVAGIVISSAADQLAMPDLVGTGVAQSGDWRLVLAAAINAVGVLVLVQLVKRWWPWLRATVPWVFPILTSAIGPALALGQNWLAGQLGVAIDLSPVLAAVTAPMATAAHQVYRQAR